MTDCSQSASKSRATEGADKFTRAAEGTEGSDQLHVFKLVAGLIASCLIGGCGPRLPYRINVPTEFRRDPPGWLPPNGEPERVRYRTAYEAFWWNCTILKSRDLEDRSPRLCVSSELSAPSVALVNSDQWPAPAPCTPDRANHDCFAVERVIDVTRRLAKQESAKLGESRRGQPRLYCRLDCENSECPLKFCRK